ncbi:MAG: TauD/TfdA family dioxygenase [Granulosicoccus sp.]
MLPANIPRHFTGKPAWVAKDLRDDENAWLRILSQAEISELEAAAENFLTQHGDIGLISRETFELPSLHLHLQFLQKKLLHGIGVEVLRGLRVNHYPTEMAACIFCGIGAHLGSARSQNANGHILGHVRDTGASSDNPDVRVYQTAERQSFHTDSADVVALLCLKRARTGGESLLVSALSIYNRFRQQRPDLLPLLFEPIATDRRGEVPAGEQPFMTIPPLSWYDGKLTVFYQRQYIDSAQRFEDAPALTPRHIEALDLFDSLANNPELHFSMQLEPGDMQFVYNHSQLHDRTAFEDWEEAGEKRHLLRLWLSIHGDRKLPACFRQRYGSIEIGDRGGIVTSNARLSAPLFF